MRITLAFIFALIILGSQNLQAVTYEWTHPQPQGNHLSDIAFFDSQTGWAVGQFGTVLKTTDGGSHWVVLKQGDLVYWQKVVPVSQNEVWIFGDHHYSNYGPNGTAISISHDGGNSWRSVEPPDVGRSFRGAQYFNGEIWLLTQYPLVKSTADGGQTWTSRLNVAEPYDMCVLDSQTAWVASDWGIHSTVNGGVDWTQIGPQAKKVSFFDRNHGWAVSGYSRLIHTSDAGTTWDSVLVIDLIQYSHLQTVLAVDTNAAFIGLGPYNGGIARTEDGGQTFEVMVDFNHSIQRIVRAENTYWACGGVGDILRSEDEGDSWQSLLEFPVSEYIRQIEVFPSGSGWMTSDVGIYRTEDFARNWTPVSLALPATILGFDCLNEDNCWFIADSGYTLSTENGGESWEIISVTNVFLDRVSRVDDSIAWAVADGDVYRTLDGGENWIIVRNGEFRDVAAWSAEHAIVIMDSSNADDWHHYMVSYRTSNGGADWSRSSSTMSFLAVNSVEASHGLVVCGTGGDVFVSPDSGATWRTGEIGSGSTLRTTIINDHEVWVAGSDGELFVTRDAGVTWKMIAFTWNDFHDIDAIDDCSCILVGDAGSMIRVNGGGADCSSAELTIVAVGNDILLDWTNIPHATLYRVFGAPEDNGGYTEIATTTETFLRLTDAALQSASQRYFVRADTFEWPVLIAAETPVTQEDVETRRHQNIENRKKISNTDK